MYLGGYRKPKTNMLFEDRRINLVPSSPFKNAKISKNIKKGKSVYKTITARDESPVFKTELAKDQLDSGKD